MTVRRADITGAYTSPVGRRPGLNSLELHGEAFLGALEDADLAVSEVDGLITLGSFSMPYLMHATAIAEFLGLRQLRHASSMNVGGASAVAAVNLAAVLVGAGVCRHVVVLSGDDQLSGMTRDLALRAMLANRHAQYEGPYGPTTAAAYAMAARRYLHEYRLDPDDLAWPSVQSRAHAVANPAAMMREPMSVDDVNASKPIAEPLRMLHCAPIADGGAAVVIGPASSQARGGRRPVRVAGAGERYENAHLVFNRSLVESPAAAAAQEAYREAGIGVDQLDVALVYDAFASSLAATVEDLGLVSRGGALKAFAEGEFDRSGRLPVNPHGGLLSGGHPGYPGGLFHVVEAVRQIRGTSDVQLPHVERAVVHGSGGIMTTQAVMVLEGGDGS